MDWKKKVLMNQAETGAIVIARADYANEAFGPNHMERLEKPRLSGNYLRTIIGSKIESNRKMDPYFLFLG